MLVASGAVLFAGCFSSPYSSETKAAFQKAVASVQKVDAIAPIPPPGLLSTEVSKLGGYPSTAAISYTQKSGEQEVAVGYDSSKKPVIAIVLDRGGIATFYTDAPVVAGFDEKVAKATGRPQHVAEGDGSSDSGHSGGDEAGHGLGHSGGKIKCGMTKAQVKAKLGPPDSIGDEGGCETWYSTPFNVAAEASEAGISALTSGMGFFSGPAMSAANKAKPKREFYIIKFSGDTVVDVALVKS